MELWEFLYIPQMVGADGRWRYRVRSEGPEGGVGVQLVEHDARFNQAQRSWHVDLRIRLEITATGRAEDRADGMSSHATSRRTTRGLNSTSDGRPASAPS